MLVKGKTGSYAVLQVTAQHTLARQLSTAREHDQTYSTAIGTHGSARHFDLTFIDTQAMVAVDVCISGGQGDGSEWRDNMQQYRWRALANPDAHAKCYLSREMGFLQAQPLATHIAF